MLRRNKALLSTPFKVFKCENVINFLDDFPFRVKPGKFKETKCIILGGALDVMIHRSIKVLFNKLAFIVNHSQVEVCGVDALARCKKEHFKDLREKALLSVSV